MNNIKEKIRKNELLCDKDLENFFTTIVCENKLNRIINYILFQSKESTNFSSDKKMIIMNLNDLWYEVTGKANIRTNNEQLLLSEDERNNNTVNNKNKANIYNIAAFYHEIRHAYQYKVLLDLLNGKDIETYYEAILYKNLITSVLDNNLNPLFKGIIYRKYHNYFFDEYDSNIYSYEKVLDLFNSFDLPDLKKLLELYNKLIAKNIYFEYKDIYNVKTYSTPSLNLIKLYNNLFEMNGNSFEDEFLSYENLEDIKIPNDEIDRLKLGLSLRNTTLKHIKNIGNGKDKTLNLFDDIKNI